MESRQGVDKSSLASFLRFLGVELRGSHNSGPGRCFVMMTGSTDTRVIQQWTGLPSEQIVPKPFDIATLLNAVRRLTNYGGFPL